MNSKLMNVSGFVEEMPIVNIMEAVAVETQMSRKQVFGLVEDLKVCSRTRNLKAGKQLHTHAISTGLDTFPFVITALLNMYSKCGSMSEARKIFDTLRLPNVVCWNCLIQGYVDNGECELALNLLKRMQLSSTGLVPDARTFVAGIMSCAMLAAREDCKLRKNKWLKEGKALHLLAVTSRCYNNIYLQNTLIDMYSKCGSMAFARAEFDRMSQRNSISWTALIQGYVANDQSEIALELFQRMEDDSSCVPNARTYLAALTACVHLAGRENQSSELERLIDLARTIHSRAVANGCCDIFVETTLVDLYSRCGNMLLARSIFNKMIRRNVVTWTVLLQGYVENGEFELALQLFNTMEEAGPCAPNARTYIVALSACGALGASQRETAKVTAMGIHVKAVENHCYDNVFVQNTLIDTYGKLGKMVEARAVFDDMHKRTTVSWTSLLQGYIENGESELALELFERMEQEAGDSCLPSSTTYVFALTACAASAQKQNPGAEKSHWLEKAKYIHSRAVENHCSDDIYVQNTLVDVYSCLSSTELARSVFDGMVHHDIVSWNALLQGYAENGQGEIALHLFFNSMQLDQGCVPNARTYVAALTACASLATKNEWSVEQVARVVHSQAVSSSCCDIYVETSLTNLYAKCGTMSRARLVFDGMSQLNTVSWNCLIQGYVDNGENEHALEVFSCMEANGVPRNLSTYVAAVMACGNLTLLETGKRLHREISDSGFLVEKNGDLLATCLVDFYGKCGDMEAGKLVFDSIYVKDIYAWNAMIGGYSNQGNTMQVFQLVEDMEKHGVAPDEVTCTHLLTACAHAGLVDKGKEYFELMRWKFKVEPNLIHYNCMVDLLGRDNRLEEALSVIRSMPFEADEVTWTLVLGACRKWNNLAVGKVAYDSLRALGKQIMNASAVVSVV